MMEPRYAVWERLIVYREELIRLCERVAMELAENREKREAWLAWSESWKRRHQLVVHNQRAGTGDLQVAADDLRAGADSLGVSLDEHEARLNGHLAQKGASSGSES